MENESKVINISLSGDDLKEYKEFKEFCTELGKRGYSIPTSESDLVKMAISIAFERLKEMEEENKKFEKLSRKSVGEKSSRKN